MDKIFSNRDEFFNFIVTSSYKHIIEESFTLREILQDSQKFNLLCENEVSYFYDHGHHLKPHEEFFNNIQQRLLLHRVQELKIKNAKIKKGGFISLANGSRIQGTTGVGGLQPDYIIDSKSKEIQQFLKDISYLKYEKYSVWEKINTVGNILREKYLHRTEYEDPDYLELLKHYREAQLEIPLSEYIKINRGVCRESSLLTTLGLNSIGVESYYYYAKVTSKITGDEKSEDHAIVLVNINSSFWTVDNYFRGFNQHKFEDIHSLEGVETYFGLMYDEIDPAKKGHAYIKNSRLYPEAKHNTTYIS